MSFCYVSRMDPLCYVGGEVTLASQRRSVTPLIKKAYHLYFVCNLRDQDDVGAAHCVQIMCNTSWRLDKS